jgi:tetratricopeptide (TPR) repeat protein
MAPFDRDAALKSAEKSLRLGKIDAAIAEYVKIVEAQPRDWNSANALGDLYMRAKQVDNGIAQYTRIAEHLTGEGFYPKAAAVYKKILKFKPDDEPSLLKSGEIAARQGLLADAKVAFRSVAERRRKAGDNKGAAEISIRIGTLDPEDLEARLGAARAAIEIGDSATALHEFREVGSAYDKQGNTAAALDAFESAYTLDSKDAKVRTRLLDGYLDVGELDKARLVAVGGGELKRIVKALEQAGRTDDVLEVLAEIVQINPKDVQVRADLAIAYFARQQYDKAREFLTPETAGKKAPLWLTLAEIELVSGRPDEGRAAVIQALTVDSKARDAAIALGSRLTERSPEAGYPCLDAVAEVALRDSDYSGAAAALNEFVTRVPSHVVALMRMVEVCVDGGLESSMQRAQAQLADAYLQDGRALEARIISEDLVAREPWNTENIDRFRRALTMLGESDPDSIIADRLSGDSPFLASDTLDLNEGVFFEDAPAAQPKSAATPSAAAPPPAPPAPPAPSAPAKAKPAPAPAPPAPSVLHEPIVLDDEELIELAIDEEVLAPVSGPPEPAPPRPAPAAKADEQLDDVFAQMRQEAAVGSEDEVAAEQYGLALTYRELGMLDDAIQALEVAASSPRQRFEAAAQLAEVHLERHDVDKAISWYERAAESPAPNATEGRNLLYSFAETLEKAGQHARALAVFVELEAEAGGYRDVAYRILRLSKLQAKG